MKTKSKKPTNKEIVDRLNFLLMQTNQLQNYMSNLMELVNHYIEFNNDSDKFKKFIKKKLDE